MGNDFKIRVVKNIGEDSVGDFGPVGTVFEVIDGKFKGVDGCSEWGHEDVPFKDIQDINKYFGEKDQWQTVFELVEEPNNQPLTISQIVKEVGENAVSHGWWDGPERNFGELIALCHSELSEALEENRKGKSPTETYYREDGKPEGIPSELADVVIRVFDMCHHYGIDIESMILEKHEFNKSRPYKHGKEF